MSPSTMYGMSAPSALSQGNRRSDYADPVCNFMLEIRGGPEVLGNSRGRGIVTQDVHAVLRQLRSTRRSQHAGLHHLPRQRLAVVLAQHVGAPQMPMIAERCRESDGERQIPQ